MAAVFCRGGSKNETKIYCTGFVCVIFIGSIFSFDALSKDVVNMVIVIIGTVLILVTFCYVVIKTQLNK